MKKRLQLKKITLRNLDDEATDRIAGGATQKADSCWNTTCTLVSCCGTCGYPCGGGGGTLAGTCIECLPTNQNTVCQSHCGC